MEKRNALAPATVAFTRMLLTLGLRAGSAERVCLPLHRALVVPGVCNMACMLKMAAVLILDQAI